MIEYIYIISRQIKYSNDDRRITSFCIRQCQSFHIEPSNVFF